MRRPSVIDGFAMNRMMFSPILWATVGLIAMLNFPAPAAPAPDDRSLASSRAAAARDSRAKSEHTLDRRPAQTGALSRTVANSRHTAAVIPRRGLVTPQQPRHQGVGGSADPVGASRDAQDPARLARELSRPARANGATSGITGPAGPGPSKRNPVPMSKAIAVTRSSTIGGPRAQSSGRLSGTAVGRANQSAAIDGKQFRRKF